MLRDMKLESPAFQNNAPIPPVHTCDSRDINPPLAWSGVPDSAKSLTLIVDDPDAPRGDWVHWLVWNIAPTETNIAENSVPAGAAEGTTDFGRSGWGGPCPPSGVHRYQFKLYALDTTLNLPPTTKKSGLLAAIEGHTLAQTLLVGKYSRQK